MNFISIATKSTDAGVKALSRAFANAGFQKTIATEIENLLPYLKSYAARLEDLDIRADELQSFIAKEAHTKRSLIRSTSHIFMSAKQANELKAASNDNLGHLYDLWMGPPMAKHGYGFFRSLAHRSLSGENSWTVYPTVTLPTPICAKISEYETDTFFTTLNDVMDIVNHDYAHQMTLAILDDGITGIRTNATPLLETFGQDADKINNIVNRNVGRTDPMTHMRDPEAYERWATDTHKLTLGHMFEDVAQMNQMKQRIHNCFSELGHLHDQIAQTSCAQAGEVYQYFTDLITFNLMRACGPNTPLLEYAFKCANPKKMAGYHARTAKQTFLSVHGIKLKNGDFSKEESVVLGELKHGKQNRDGIGNMLIQLDPERVLDVMKQAYKDGIFDVDPSSLNDLEGDGLKSFRRSFDYGYIARSTNELSEEQAYFRERLLPRLMHNVFFGVLDDQATTNILLALEECRRDGYGFNYRSEFEALAECDHLPTPAEMAETKCKTFRGTQIFRGFENDDRAQHVAKMDTQIIGMLKANAS